MKLLAKFTGKLVTFNEPPAPSHVTLTDTSNGKTIDATGPSDKLQEKGIINAGDDFEIIIEENDDGKQIATINKVLPTPESSTNNFAI